MRVAWILLALFFWSNFSWAACFGSSPTWTAASPSSADIADCVSDASDGDTINVPAGAGSVTWSGSVSLPNTKSLSLIGPGASNLTVSNSSLTALCANGKTHRISGIRFEGSSSINFYGTCSGFRIDHNVFYDVSNDPINIDAGVNLQGPIYGLIDNNQFTSTGSNFRAIIMFSGGIEYGVRTNWSNDIHLGTVNNIFIEDNVFDYGTHSDTGSGVVDSNSGAAWVFRFNTVTNSSIKSHGVCNSEGTANQTVYGNTLISNAGNTNGYRLIHQQGSGEAIYFGNQFSATGGKSGSALEILHYRSADGIAAGCSLYPRCDGSAANSSWDQNQGPRGYRCRYQPGSRGGPNGTSLLSPIYAWDNSWSDTGQNVSINIEHAWPADTGPTVYDHVKSDRDYYDAVSNLAQTSPVSPFDGTTGVGFGTLANRPTTCTTNPDEAGGGVGFWATDVGEWNSNNAGPDGQLYRCSATNTWALHYIAYPYPHPLAAVRPEAPTALSVD